MLSLPVNVIDMEAEYAEADRIMKNHLKELVYEI